MRPHWQINIVKTIGQVHIENLVGDMSWELTKESFYKSELSFFRTLQTWRCRSLLERGPWIMLHGDFVHGNQFVCQKFMFLPSPMFQIISFSQMHQPIRMFLQIKELFLLEYLPTYFVVRTFAQSVDVWVNSLHVRPVMRAIFIFLIFRRPRPPTFLGMVIVSQFRQWSFLEFWLQPHRKSLCFLSICL